MSESNKTIWECLDNFSGKDPSEMTAKEIDKLAAQIEFQAECEKDDRMMEEIDGITEIEMGRE